MKTAIITGATGNLGSAVIEKFKTLNYRIVATTTPKSAGAQLGAGVDAHPVDLTNEAATHAFVESVLQKYGGVDVALLLVGGYASGTVAQTDMLSVKKMLSLNFDTAFHVAQPVFQSMLARGYGRIVLVGSRPALNPKDARHSVGYAFAKSLLLRLAEVLNIEGATHNVLTTVVVPSTIDTPANRKDMPDADFTKWVSPATIADAMAIAVSGEADAWRESVIKVYGRA
ncbi:MAG: SDR family NAD(P)-dependent oxidoreductase [Bacteroidia bacterium]|nr:SDR family NAD(P)-dependent oxidoreductase [Bacteroidia bacterium]